MDLSVILLSVVVILFFANVFSNQKRHKHKNLPPGPKPLPIVGNMHMIDMKQPYKTFMEVIQPSCQTHRCSLAFKANFDISFFKDSYQYGAFRQHSFYLLNMPCSTENKDHMTPGSINSMVPLFSLLLLISISPHAIVPHDLSVFARNLQGLRKSFVPVNSI